MPSPRRCLLLWALGLCALIGFLPRAHAQAALLMEEPYGFFGTLNPTGHNAVYFARVCTVTPVKLRRCGPSELGSVIARYQGIAGYDWVAIPLLPYLYSVESAGQVPAHVDRKTVLTLRDRYHEQHLGVLGANVFEGSFTHGGWNQLIGVAYERRIYAFRFNTTPEQDDALIAHLNSSPNVSEFNLTYNNCADFARNILNGYFPNTFRRTLFPDAGMTTPRQIASKLVKYSKKHPETDLQVFEIPQIPGFRRMSHANKSVSAALITTGYAIPIVLLNPYVAGGILVDYLVRGRYPVITGPPPALTPYQLATLSDVGLAAQSSTQAAPVSTDIAVQTAPVAAVPVSVAPIAPVPVAVSLPARSLLSTNN